MVGNLICNNLVYWGSAAAGGGIACGDGTTLINNTIVGNYSSYAGGGIVYWTSSAPDTFKNNIVWGNYAYSGDPQIHLWEGSLWPVIIYSDIQGGWAGEGNLDADPLLADTAGGDFRLTWANYPAEDSSRSPGIDSGDPASPPDSDGTRADMGAIAFDRRSQGVDEGMPLPDRLALSPNYPNPFNAATVIEFTLPQEEHVTLTLYDLLGRKVADLYHGRYAAGAYRYNLQMHMPSGIYFYALQAERSRLIRKMTVVK